MLDIPPLACSFLEGCSVAIWAASRKKNNKMACAPSEASDQPGHPPSLIRVFAVHMKKAWVLCYPLSEQWRLWSDWVDAQADLSLRWAHMPFCWFCHKAAHWWSCLLSQIDIGKQHYKMLCITIYVISIKIFIDSDIWKAWLGFVFS